MEKMQKYETLFVVDVTLGEDAVKALVEKYINRITENGEIIEVNEWGKRKLAYEIDYKTEGYYVLVTFKSQADFPARLERSFTLNEGIMRSIVIKKEA